MLFFYFSFAMGPGSAFASYLGDFERGVLMGCQMRCPRWARFVEWYRCGEGERLSRDLRLLAVLRALMLPVSLDVMIGAKRRPFPKRTGYRHPACLIHPKALLPADPRLDCLVSCSRLTAYGSVVGFSVV